jgi:hypothetical protein
MSFILTRSLNQPAASAQKKSRAREQKSQARLFGFVYSVMRRPFGSAQGRL